MLMGILNLPVTNNSDPTTINIEVVMDVDINSAIDSTNPVDHASSDHNSANVLETAK